AACVGGVALPGRLDDAVRIACVKRFPGTKVKLSTVGLSLIILGMLDNAALAPMASVAAADASSWSVRLGFVVVAIGGVLAAIVVVTGAAVILLVAAWQIALRVKPHFMRVQPVAPVPAPAPSRI